MRRFDFDKLLQLVVIVFCLLIGSIYTYLSIVVAWFTRHDPELTAMYTAVGATGLLMAWFVSKKFKE